jgi:Flp pilus assembly pilin Flp
LLAARPEESFWNGQRKSIISTERNNMINKLMKNESGQGMTEYVIILVSIAIVCIAIAVQFGGEIKALFETADAEIDTVDANM